MSTTRRRALSAAAAITRLTAIAVLPLRAHASARGTYIVVLKAGSAGPRQVAEDHSRRHDSRVTYVYKSSVRGYAASIPVDRVDDVRSDPNVAYVEEDTPVRAVQRGATPTPTASPSSPPPGGGRGGGGGGGSAQLLPWGIDRVGADTSSTLAGNGSGAVSNVNVYVIDTGVGTHSDLNLVGHVNFAGGQNTDCNGHGTHVAGTIAARDNSFDVVGVAPGAPITGVKVLGCSGSGSTSGVIAGIDWVTAHASKPAVANMSLGGGASNALDQAVATSAASGVFYAVAAGNEGQNACNTSPARAGAGTNNGIMTVAATDAAENEASWSNYGPCVDVWAPGVSILSTKNNGGTTTMSGTSMASPHGAGGGALYLSANTGAGASTVEAAITSAAQSTGKTSKSGVSIKREFVGGL